MTLSRRESLRFLAAAPLAGTTLPYRQVTIFEAARIITMEPTNPNARFVAVADGIILAATDSLAALKPWTEGRAVNLDRRFAKAVLLPGFIDPHIHPMQAAVMLNIPFLAPDEWKMPHARYPGVRTPQAWRVGLKALLASSADDPLIVWGHHELFHGPIDRAELDAFAPDRALIIWQRSFHDVIVNTAVLKSWGMETKSAFDAAVIGAKADPAHADHGSGIMSETALLLALGKMRPVLFGSGKIALGMGRLKQMLRQGGVTTTSDMGTGIFASFETEADLIRSAFSASDSMARVMLMPTANGLAGVEDVEAWLAGARQRYAGRNVRVDRRVKLLADGAFFALNMRMNAPGYLDGHAGKWITEPDVLAAQASRFWNAGFSMHIHVNGDEGLDVVLAAVERLAPRHGQTVTLEHLGYSTEAQNRRIARAGLMVSAQPNYIRVLGDAYETHGLGPDRAAAMNRLGSLERKSVPLGLHSDFNMAPVDPLYLAWIAANRVTVGGVSKAPSQRLSLDKALRAVTIEAAQVIGMDAMVGSISPGKKADFVALDRDPYGAGAAALRQVAVAGLVFEGKAS